MKNARGISMKNARIAILYICTGRYVEFWKDFYISFEQKFLINSLKEYFVFTDADFIYAEDESNNVHRIEQENLGWPGNTLFRFRMFKRIESQLKEFDYIFFMNANIICMKKVEEEVFLPREESLLVVQHPGWYAKKPFEFEYDRNKKSSACIKYLCGEVYVCGGVNGGKAEAFLKLVNELNERIEKDYSNGIIARWHDESHLNKYIIENGDFKLLSPSFCYPEGKELPYEKYLLVLDKKKVISLDNNKINNQRLYRSSLQYKINRARRNYWAIIYFIYKNLKHFKGLGLN